MASTNRKIAKISALLILVSLVGNLFSLLKEMLVAQAFGISTHMDAFYAALAIPSFISGILMVVLSSIFIPVYTTIGLEQRDRLASATITWTIIISFLFILPFTIFPQQLIQFFFHGLNSASTAIATSLLCQLSWTILLTILLGLLTGLLNAREIFAVPAASTICVTLCTMGAVVYFSKNLGIYALSYGLVGGMLLQSSILWKELRRDGFSYTFSLNLRHAETIKLLASLLIFMLAVIINQANFFLSQMIASWLPQGSVSAMGYAGKLLQFPMTVFTGAIVTAVMPYFAKQTSEGDMDGLAYSLSRSIRMTAYVFIPFALLNIVFAKPFIRLLFERGRFDPAATDLIATTFILFAPQIFFNTSGMIISKVYFALKELKIFLKLNLLILPLNILFSLALMKLINPPVSGLALAVSLSYATGAILLYNDIRKKLPQINNSYIFDGIIKSFCAGLIATIIAGAGLWLLYVLLPGQLLLPVILSSIMALVAMIWASHWLRIDEYFSALKIMQEKIAKMLS